MTADQQRLPYSRNRVRVFIDYWNLQLTLNTTEARFLGTARARFRIDWTLFPRVLADEAAAIADLRDYSYDGSIVYASYNAKSEASLGRWLTTWLNRQPGIQVVSQERRPRRPPTCPSCKEPVEHCPHCGQQLAATVEKGIDTAMVTDLVRLAWEDAYDVGVIVSSDSDFVPAVRFLDSRGLKMIQAGFPPLGVELATSCWASFDVFPLREKFRRQLESD